MGHCGEMFGFSLCVVTNKTPNISGLLDVSLKKNPICCAENGLEESDTEGQVPWEAMDDLGEQ